MLKMSSELFEESSIWILKIVDFLLSNVFVHQADMVWVVMGYLTSKNFLCV